MLFRSVAGTSLRAVRLIEPFGRVFLAVPAAVPAERTVVAVLAVAVDAVDLIVLLLTIPGA